MIIFIWLGRNFLISSSWMLKKHYLFLLFYYFSSHYLITFFSFTVSFCFFCFRCFCEYDAILFFAWLSFFIQCAFIFFILRGSKKILNTIAFKSNYFFNFWRPAKMSPWNIRTVQCKNTHTQKKKKCKINNLIHFQDYHC